MDDRRLFEIAARYGTPCFVFDEAQLKRRMEAIRAITGDAFSLCYSVKANPFLIPAMGPHVTTFEVCSIGELSICEALGIDMHRVLLSGVNKTAQDIEHAMNAGVTHFTAESPLQVHLLNEAALACGRVFPVLLRLTAGTQFGMDERDLTSILRAHERFPGLRFTGLHYFAGTQRKKLSEQIDELALLDALLWKLREETGLPLQELEYGPGLYFPYFANEDDSDTLAPLRALMPALKGVNAHLTVEMGRFFVSECGTYLTTVADTKVNDGHAYAILDGGIHHVNYIGSNMGMRVPRISHLHGPERVDEESVDWALCGSLCTTADVLVRRISLQGLERGDVLAFQSIGAYAITEGPALFLSRDLPRVILADGKGERLARDDVPSYTLNTPCI